MIVVVAGGLCFNGHFPGAPGLAGFLPPLVPQENVWKLVAY